MATFSSFHLPPYFHLHSSSLLHFSGWSHILFCHRYLCPLLLVVLYRNTVSRQKWGNFSQHCFFLQPDQTMGSSHFYNLWLWPLAHDPEINPRMKSWRLPQLTYMWRTDRDEATQVYSLQKCFFQVEDKEAWPQLEHTNHTNYSFLLMSCFSNSRWYNFVLYCVSLKYW